MSQETPLNPEKQDVIFKADGSPFSETFDDIYFDTQSGYSQSEHVFVLANKIEQKLSEPEANIVIGETGFGTGLNFFITLKYFEQALLKQPKSQATLTFISVEKYPLTSEQITQSLNAFPELSDMVATFCQQYQNRDSNQTISQFCFFNSRVKLIIVFDDAALGFSQLTTKPQEARKQKLHLIPEITHWYLDGFSPAKNPQMWSEALFYQLARLSQDNASLATFTVAGIVKRGLMQVGFRLQKQTTTGRKNKSLVARFQQSTIAGKGYLLRPRQTKPSRVAVIGSGIAAACLAYKLTKANIRVTLYCEDEALAQGASSNAIGAVYPLLHQAQDDISLYYQQAFESALTFYQSLTQEGIEYPHDWCGVLELAFKPALQERLQKFNELAAWPENLIHVVDAQQASKHANMSLEHGGLFMPRAGWVAPQKLVEALFDAAMTTNYLKVKTSCQVKNLSQQDDLWRLDLGKKQDKASHVIMAGGAQTPLLAPFSDFPLYPVRGQVSAMATNDDIGELATVICHKGYLTPKHNDSHCIGATFDKDVRDIQTSQEDDEYNLRMYHQCLPNFPQWQLSDVKHSKARLRCMSPDHMPIAGPMPKTNEYYGLYQRLEKDKNWRVETPAPYYDNLYVMTGLGARGLCSAPLLADIIMADICQTPYPVDSKMLFNLAPNRFILKDIIKGKFKAGSS